MVPRRRLFVSLNETEVSNLGQMTLTSHRVIIVRRGWFNVTCEAVGLDTVASTSVEVSRWGYPRLVVYTHSRRLVLRLGRDDFHRLRAMADDIDAHARLSRLMKNV